MKPTVLFLFLLLFMISLSEGQTFTLKSADLGGQFTNQQVYNSFGCTGANISPELSWVNPPTGTKSFAVTMYDPDAPTGSGWWHWLIFDIPASTKELVSDAGNMKMNLAPKGSVQSMTDFGKPGYGGPCPPQGDKPHTYVVTLFALNVDKLGLDEKSSPAMVGFNISSHMIGKATIVAYFGR